MSLSLGLESGFDVLEELGGRDGGVVAADGFAIAANQELLEVPPHIGVVQRLVDEAGLRSEAILGWFRAARLEELVDGMLVRSVDADLLRDREAGLEAISRPHPLHTSQDLSLGGRLLVVELIAGQGENGETAGGVLVLERIQVGVLEGVPSVRRHVHH